MQAKYDIVRPAFYFNSNDCTTSNNVRSKTKKSLKLNYLKHICMFLYLHIFIYSQFDHFSNVTYIYLEKSFDNVLSCSIKD